MAGRMVADLRLEAIDRTELLARVVQSLTYRLAMEDNAEEQISHFREMARMFPGSEHYEIAANEIERWVQENRQMTLALEREEVPA